MDSKRFHEAFERLQALDDIYIYKVRPRAGAMRRPDIDDIAEQHKHLAEYTIGLKEVLHELFESIATPTKTET